MVICKINSFIGLVFYAVIYWSLWFECKKNPSETHDRLNVTIRHTVTINKSFIDIAKSYISINELEISSDELAISINTTIYIYR